MKKTTLNHLSMYQNVLAVVNDNQSTWSGVQGIVSTVNEFQDLINSLSLKLKHQTTVTQGIRLKKDVYLKELKDDMSKLKKALFLYALETGNLVLRERNRESKTTLAALSANRLQVTSQSLLEDLQTYGSELGAVGISPEQIQDFSSKAALLEDHKNSVRQAIIERTLETRAINSLEKQLNLLLTERLDRFVSLLASTNSAFAASYLAARKVIDTGGHAGHRPNEKGAA